jgi:DNA-binding response OmpR family regulator
MAGHHVSPASAAELNILLSGEMVERPLFIALADDTMSDRMIIARSCVKAQCGAICFAEAKSLVDDYRAFVNFGGESRNYADAIILDFEMPAMRGDVGAELLREAGYQGPIFVVSSSPEAAAACTCATMTFAKPFTGAMVTTILEYVKHQTTGDNLNAFPRSLPATNATSISQQQFVLEPKIPLTTVPDKDDRQIQILMAQLVECKRALRKAQQELLDLAALQSAARPDATRGVTVVGPTGITWRCFQR